MKGSGRRRRCPEALNGWLPSLLIPPRGGPAPRPFTALLVHPMQDLAVDKKPDLLVSFR